MDERTDGLGVLVYLPLPVRQHFVILWLLFKVTATARGSFMSPPSTSTCRWDKVLILLLTVSDCRDTLFCSAVSLKHGDGNPSFCLFCSLLHALLPVPANPLLL